MDYKMLPRYQMTFEGRLMIARMRELANDPRPARSPIIGIPISLADGTRVCIKVRRDLLQAACELAESAHWDATANRLVLNGGKRSCYKLIPMNETYASNGIRIPLAAWAEAQRKRAIAKSASPGERKAKRIEHEIGVLERKLDKIHARRPVNPICQAPREIVGYWGRDTELAWCKGKRVRRMLARKFTAPALAQYRGVLLRPKWKELYAQAALILGVEEIPEYDRHSRVTRLTRGPSELEYIRHPEKYLARMSKPWTRGRDRDQSEAETEVEAMRRQRKEYLEDMSMRRAIETQIENLQEVRRTMLEADSDSRVAHRG